MAPGATANPHDPARTPGGSSSGSGAAVADFMTPLAFGTQTGGSVLRPAAFCGVIGYKPTFGTFNRAGLKFAAESIDTIGLIAREVEDMALMSSALTGAPFVAPSAPERPLRIGLCRTYLWEKADASARQALQRAAEAARSAGADVRDYEMPAHFSRLTETREIFNNVERARSLPDEWTRHREKISAVLSRSIEAGFATSEADYLAAKTFAERCRLEADAIFDDFDVLLAPAANGEAPVGLHYAGDPSFQGLWTLLHTPTIAVPAGRGDSGMPVGVQLIARRYDDKRLLDAAHWLITRAGVVAMAA
jgi:amidase